MIFWLLPFFIGISLPAKAHILGVSSWCVANSAIHFECYFLDQERCEQEAQHRSRRGEDWQCVPFPVDFRNIPKSGETVTSPSVDKKTK